MSWSCGRSRTRHAARRSTADTSRRRRRASPARRAAGRRRSTPAARRRDATATASPARGPTVARSARAGSSSGPRSWRPADTAVTRARIRPESCRRLGLGPARRRARVCASGSPSRSAPGEHVTGFGERFDALDHRGTELDSVVFEQYKNQGAERKTYLPMPFAHVVGGDGWGFHVDTSRRVLVRLRAVRSRDDPRRGRAGCARRRTGPDGLLARALLRRRRRRRCSAASSSDAGSPRSCPPGCSGSGRAATSGTPRPR